LSTPVISKTQTTITGTVTRIAGFRWYGLEIVSGAGAVIRRKQHTLALPVDEQPATMDITIAGLTPNTPYIVRAAAQDTGAFADL
jgi:hypothetical protein